MTTHFFDECKKVASALRLLQNDTLYMKTDGVAVTSAAGL